MSGKLKFTLKAWPAIAALTIGLCYLTQVVAGWIGIELPDQANLELVRKWAGWNKVFISLCVQVLVIMPAIEETVFRWLLFKLPMQLTRRLLGGQGTGDARRGVAVLVPLVSSALFSAAHYIAQPWPDAAFIALFFFGLAQCWLYAKTERLWCPMLNHFLFNLTNLVLLFFLPQQ